MAVSLFEAYVSGEAQAFFATNFLRVEDRRRAVQRALRPLAPHVLAGIEAQNARLGASPARAARLADLARGAAAVVTGQQVGLFLGPLYTVYKAASAVCVARALAAESGQPVVPVFWLQTEDHDLVEIAHCSVLRPEAEPLRLALAANADNRVSIAHLRLPVEVNECLAALASALQGLPQTAAHLEQLARHYRPGAGWSDAFAGVLAELFEPEGLLLIDPRDAAFAPEATALHERAIASTKPLATQLLERCHRLEAAGFPPNVHVREDSPLSFFHANGRHAPRHRLSVTGADFTELGSERRHSHAALQRELARDPLCFSTSALLRPLLQDALLPTAAYVGGPAEVAYFAQMPPLYAAFGLEMPLVVPRARLRVIEAESDRLLTRLGLEAGALAQNEEALLRALAADGGEHATPAAFEQQLCEGFERVLASALEPLGAHAAQLSSAADKTRDKLRLTAGKLRERYTSVLARADQGRVADLLRLQRALQPAGQPQERVYGLSYFAARYGGRAFIERVLHAIEPFEPSVKELRL